MLIQISGSPASLEWQRHLQYKRTNWRYPEKAICTTITALIIHNSQADNFGVCGIKGKSQIREHLASARYFLFNYWKVLWSNVSCPTQTHLPPGAAVTKMNTAPLVNATVWNIDQSLGGNNVKYLQHWQFLYVTSLLEVFLERLNDELFTAICQKITLATWARCEQTVTVNMEKRETYGYLMRRFGWQYRCLRLEWCTFWQASTCMVIRACNFDQSELA